MKKNASVKFTALTVTAVLLTLSSLGQTYFPNYKKVLEEFYFHYLQEAKNTESLNFAKRKEGWYVEKTDLIDNKLVSSDLFWSQKENKFNSLGNYERHDYKEPFVAVVAEKLLGYDAYSYERCRYYGYNDWDKDMIADFGNATITNDTLLEGLARAYSNYAGRFSWYQSGGIDSGTDTLQRLLKKLEYPTDVRIEKINYYTDKSIETYKILAKKNPFYNTLVGSVSIRLLNEQLHHYADLQLFNREKEAKDFLRTIIVDSNTKKVGYNYLNSCPQNAVLITFGDNDTYPLWYLQEMENVRKDVTVINYSMLAFAPYLSLLKRNKNIDFSTTQEEFGGDSFDYFYRNTEKQIPFPQNDEPNIDLKEFISIIRSGRFKLKTQTGGDIISFPANAVTLRVDSLQYQRSFKQSIKGNEITWGLPEYMMLNDFIVFDLIASNFHTRPICFTADIELFKHYGNFYNYGIIHRLTTTYAAFFDIRSESDYRNISDFFTRYYKPVTFKKNCPYNYANMDEIHSDVYYMITQYYVGRNNNVQGKFWSKKYLDSYKNDSIPFLFNAGKMAVSLFRSGLTSEAIKYLEMMAEKLMYSYKNYRADFFVSKDMATEQINQYYLTITSKKFESKKIKIFLDELKNKTD